MKRTLILMAAIAVMMAAPAFANPNNPAKSKPPTAQQQAAKSDEATAPTKIKTTVSSSDIATTLASSGSYKTLTGLLQTAGLSDTLKGSGPYTIFAPTDAAFAKLPQATLEDLLKPQNKAKLRSVLTYHIIPGKLNSSEISGKQLSQSTVEGSPLSISGKSSAISISSSSGTAKISGSEIACANGIIMPLDTVLMPAASAPPKQM